MCSCCLVLILTISTLTNARPSHKRHSNRHREHNSKHKLKNRAELKANRRASKALQKDLDLLTLHNMKSPHVHFSETKPTHSPWGTPMADTITTNSSSSYDADRARRSVEHEVEMNTCQTLSLWVEIPTAEDINGNTVEVMSTFSIGSTRQAQYIYESYCAEDDEPPCTGIDTTQYTSRCKTQFTYILAYVRTMSGDVGWNRIKVRGSCVCSVKKIQNSPESSIWDFLKRR